MVYTTRTKKKIKVFFSDTVNAWINRNNLQTLFGVPEEDIEEAMNLHPDNNETDTDMYSLDYVLKLGMCVNPNEADDLRGWHERMTNKHYDLNFSETLLKVADVKVEYKTNKK